MPRKSIHPSQNPLPTSFLQMNPVASNATHSRKESKTADMQKAGKHSHGPDHPGAPLGPRTSAPPPKRYLNGPVQGVDNLPDGKSENIHAHQQAHCGIQLPGLQGLGKETQACRGLLRAKELGTEG